VKREYPIAYPVVLSRCRGSDTRLKPQLIISRGSPSSHLTASAPENASDVHTRALGYLNSDTADAKRYEHIWASLPEAIKTASIARPVDDVTSPNHKGPRPRWRSIRSVFSDSSKSGLEKGTGPIRSQSEIADPNAYRLVSKHAEATLREMRTLMRGIYSGKYLVNDGFRDNYNPTAKAGEKDWTRATTDVWEKGQQLSVGLYGRWAWCNADELSRSNEPLSLSRAFRQQEWVAEAEQCLQIDKAREAYKIGKDLPKEVNMAGWLDVLQGSTAQSSRRPGENQYGPITR
jgi:hypothetical protein